MTKNGAYKDYIENYGTLHDSVDDIEGSNVTETLLTLSACTIYWDSGHPTLRDANGGSDFCAFQHWFAMIY